MQGKGRGKGCVGGGTPCKPSTLTPPYLKDRQAETSFLLSGGTSLRESGEQRGGLVLMSTVFFPAQHHREMLACSQSALSPRGNVAMNFAFLT